MLLMIEVLVSYNYLEMFSTSSLNRIYSRVSLFAIIMFYKIAVNADFVSVEPLLLGKYSWVPMSWWPHFHQLINTQSCFMCVSVSGTYLIYTVDSLTLNIWPIALQLSTEQHLSNACIFSVRNIISLLTLRST